MAGSPLYALEEQQSHTDDVLEEKALLDGSRAQILFSKKKLFGRQLHTNNVLEEEAFFLQLRATPLFKPQAKGEARTGKRRAVAQILLLYWATVALTPPRQAGNRLRCPPASARLRAPDLTCGAGTPASNVHRV